MSLIGHGPSDRCLRLNTGHHEDMIEEYPLRRIEKGRAPARAALNSPAVSLPERGTLTYVYDFVYSISRRLVFVPELSLRAGRNRLNVQGQRC